MQIINFINENSLLFIAIIAIAGFFIGRYVGSSSAKATGGQTGKKKINMEKILGMVKEKGQVRNDDVEEFLGVSNSTAERYLEELEKEGKLTQHGKVGAGVFYTANE